MSSTESTATRSREDLGALIRIHAWAQGLLGEGPMPEARPPVIEGWARVGEVIANALLGPKGARQLDRDALGRLCWEAWWTKYAHPGEVGDWSSLPEERKEMWRCAAEAVAAAVPAAAEVARLRATDESRDGWIAGLGSVEAVREHAQAHPYSRTEEGYPVGLWALRWREDDECDPVRLRPMYVDGAGRVWVYNRGERGNIDHGDTEGWASLVETRPCLPNGTPLAVAEAVAKAEGERDMLARRLLIQERIFERETGSHTWMREKVEEWAEPEEDEALMGAWERANAAGTRADKAEREVADLKVRLERTLAAKRRWKRLAATLRQKHTSWLVGSDRILEALHAERERIRLLREQLPPEPQGPPLEKGEKAAQTGPSPAELLKEWQERVDRAGLSDDDAQALLAVVVRDLTTRVRSPDESHLLYALSCALDEIARLREAEAAARRNGGGAP